MNPTRQPQQSPDLGTTRQSLAPIFLAGNTRPDPKNPLPVLQVSQKVLYQTIKISNNSLNFQLESDVILWQPTLLNLDDEIGNNLQVVANIELSENNIRNITNKEREKGEICKTVDISLDPTSIHR